jgi:3-isopropylmalate/(R)-2-methylmalate dehydratase small subunit
MENFTRLTGAAAPLLRANIDTDVVIRINRLIGNKPGELGRFAFEAWRYRPDGGENPDFSLNRPKYRAEKILVAGRISAAAPRAKRRCGRWSISASVA